MPTIGRSSTAWPSRNWRHGTSATGQRCEVLIRGWRAPFLLRHDIAIPMQSAAVPGRRSNASWSSMVTSRQDYAKSKAARAIGVYVDPSHKGI